MNAVKTQSASLHTILHGKNNFIATSLSVKRNVDDVLSEIQYIQLMDIFKSYSFWRKPIELGSHLVLFI